MLYDTKITNHMLYCDKFFVVRADLFQKLQMFYQQRIRGIDTTTENQLKKENDNMS